MGPLLALAVARALPLGLTMPFASADAAPAAPGYPPFDQAGDDLAALIRRAAQGDRAAFRRIYETRANRLYAVALRITRQSALAADAMQEAFLQLWQNAGQFDAARGHAEAWLLSLVRYRALDLIRAMAAKPSAPRSPRPQMMRRTRSPPCFPAAKARLCIVVLKPWRKIAGAWFSAPSWMGCRTRSLRR